MPAPAPALPRILVLDADDSYTRNILQLILHALTPTTAQLDSRVLILRPSSCDWATLESHIIPHFAAIILGPGPGRPALTSTSTTTTATTTQHPAALFARLFSPERSNTLPIPTFGLCLGHQALGFAYGAAVCPAPAVLHGQLSSLELELDPHGAPRGILNRLRQHTPVVRYNSLTLDPASISDQLLITAWAQDGPSARTVMGLAHKTLPFHSVQFHPESVCSTDGAQILRSFFQVVSDSAHVNSESGLGRAKAYSALPDEILQLSELLRQHPERPIPTSTAPRFQVRSLVFKNSHLTPEEVFKNSIKPRSPLGHVWLDSADSPAETHSTGGGRQESYSHMGSVDVLLSYFAARKTLAIRLPSDQHHGSEQPLEHATTFWDWLQAVQDELQAATETVPPASEPAEPHGPAAPVGFMGYIGYELLSESLAHYNLPCRASPAVPDAELGFCNTALSFHHPSATWTASALLLLQPPPTATATPTGPSPDPDPHRHFPRSVGLSLDEYEQWTRSVTEIFQPPRPSANLPEPQTPQPKTKASGALESIVSEAEYLKAIDLAQTQIVSGESYELCLTTQFRGELDDGGDGGHFERYEGLRRANPAPYGAYVRFGSYDTTILSSSPERFMRVDASGGVEMKPIKGTARRVLADPAADLAAAKRLQRDPKERAENLMITDLIRHDLLGFCVPGTVEVSRLFGLETVATVHSLVSTVQGSLRPGLNPFHALAVAFPPGSMTGAPKLSSIEILDRLEAARPRGPYSGILGLVAVDGRADMSVVIRSAVIRNNQVSVGAGGAITSLSNKDSEWTEVRLKVDAVQRALNLGAP